MGVKIEQIKENEIISFEALCSDLTKLKTKAGKDYLSIVLTDNTGSISSKLWDINTEASFIRKGDIVSCVGESSRYQGALQLNLSSIRKSETANISDFFPTSKVPLEKLYGNLHAAIGEIKNANIASLVKSIYSDTKLGELAKTHSAGKSIHHSFVGGYLEHTISMVLIVRSLIKRYPMCNPDVLIASTLLHDIGKLIELSPYPENDYTDRGKLLGHIAIGVEIIAKHAYALGIREDREIDGILHCVLSHHGKLEYGSPVEPKTLEAMILSNVDMLDSKVQIIVESLDKKDEEELWTEYIRPLGTSITSM